MDNIEGAKSIRNMLESSLFFWDDNLRDTNNVGGSSWELRMQQLLYPFVEVKDNLLFGHGYGWCQWYLLKYELHPILYGFETIFSTSVCEFGIMGYVLYPYLFYKSYKYSKPRKLLTKQTNFQLLNIISELVLIIATGLNYFCFFGIIIVLFNKIEKYRNV